MVSSNSLPQTVDDAHHLLKRFDCVNPLTADLATPDALRHALLLVVRQSDYPMIGVCADTLDQGLKAVQDYARALGYEITPELPALDGSVYLKFNSRSGQCYAAPYPGHHRGVLVSCHSAYDTGINDTYGHLPLNLFS